MKPCFFRLTAPVLSTLFFQACNPTSNVSATPPSPPAVTLSKNVQELTPDQAEKLIQETANLLILDVREAAELDELGQLKAAVHADFFNAAQTEQILSQQDKKRPVLVYCAVGGRAKRMAAKMTEQGFSKIYLLQGGFNAWKQAGKPTVARGQ
jgi:rhodanese-related sulfurtransferase